MRKNTRRPSVGYQKLDYKITHTPEGYRDFAKELPIIKFTAREE